MIWRTLAGTLAVCPAPHCVATFTTINTWGRIKAEYAEYSGCTYRLLVGSVLWCSLTNIWRLNTVFFNDHTYQTSPVPLVTYQGHAGTEFCGWWGLQVQVFKVERWARSAGRNNTSYIGQLGKARAIFLDSTRCTTCAPCQLALVTRITTTFSISQKKSRSSSVAFPGPSGSLAVKISSPKAIDELWWLDLDRPCSQTALPLNMSNFTTSPEFMRAVSSWKVSVATCTWLCRGFVVTVASRALNEYINMNGMA